MRNRNLASDYIRRAATRLRALDVLYDTESWADVVRESQEVVDFYRQDDAATARATARRVVELVRPHVPSS